MIVATLGLARGRILDRMIAVSAIARGVALITVNPDDFRDVPGLMLVDWAASTS